MSKGTIIRTVVLIFALANQGLTIAGISPLPFEEAEVEQFVSLIITVVASLTAWWKDNDVTKNAIERKKSIKDAA
jgi:SPP1 family holin